MVANAGRAGEHSRRGLALERAGGTPQQRPAGEPYNTASRRGAAPPGLRSERRRSERRGKAVPQQRPAGEPYNTASRRGAAPPGLRSERRRSERRGKAVPQQRPAGEPYNTASLQKGIHVDIVDSADHGGGRPGPPYTACTARSEEHTSELQS